MLLFLSTNRGDGMLRSQSWPSLALDLESVEAAATVLVSEPPSHHVVRGGGRDIQHSHWSSSYIAPLSLVENWRVLKYFHALKAPLVLLRLQPTPLQSYAIKNQLGHPKPPTRAFRTQNIPYGIRDSWLPCTERSY